MNKQIDLVTEKEKEAVKILKEGGVILYKTDTIWGLGCDATQEKAVNRVYEIKRRKKDKPFICIVDSLERLKEYIEQMHPRIETLLSLHKRPLTVVYPNPKNLPDFLFGHDGSIALRISYNPSNQALISALGKPLVATSANISGEPFPNMFEEVSKKITENVDFVLHCDERSQANIPSTMVKFTTKGELIFIRD